jgi:hypothetical protein
VPGEEAAHLGFRLEVRFGVRRGGEAERVHGGAEADRRQHVGQAPPVRVVEAHAARGEQRGAGRARHRRQQVQPLAVVAAEAVVGGAEQGQGEAAAQRRGVRASGGEGVASGAENASGVSGGSSAITSPSACSIRSSRVMRHSPLGASIRPFESSRASLP